MGGKMYKRLGIAVSACSILLCLMLLTGCIEKRGGEEGVSMAADVRQNDFFEGEYIPDIEVFMQIGYVSRAAISDDGRRIYFSLSYTNAAQVITDKSLAQSIENILGSMPHLLLVDHIRFSKNGTPPGDTHWHLAIHCPSAEFFDTQIESKCLMVEKAAGAGGTDSIHPEIDGNSIPDDNNF